MITCLAGGVYAGTVQVFCGLFERRTTNACADRRPVNVFDTLDEMEDATTGQSEV